MGIHAAGAVDRMSRPVSQARYLSGMRRRADAAAVGVSVNGHKLTERRVLEHAHGWRYCLAAPMERGCVYCGASVGRGLDHVPPLAAIAELGPDALGFLFPCCVRCNVRLSAFPSRCLRERAGRLLQLLTGAAAGRVAVRLKAGLVSAACLGPDGTACSCRVAVVIE